jgi:mRNA interferase MazF
MTMTRHGALYKSGDVVLVPVQFTDTDEVKKRPGLVLFEDHDNIVIAGITSNVKMDGIPLTVAEGAIKDSVIKLNYIFTVSAIMIDSVLFSLTKERRAIVHDALVEKISALVKS